MHHPTDWIAHTTAFVALGGTRNEILMVLNSNNLSLIPNKNMFYLHSTMTKSMFKLFLLCVVND